VDIKNPVKKQPLVSIGIPTYNHLRTLQQTVESALKQDYQPLEIVISDNASDDGTEEFCRKTAQENQTVKYFRQPHNQGPLENFRQVLNRASGYFFMWLADDDWLELNYISECVHFLQANADYALACGKTFEYYEKTGALNLKKPTDLFQADGRERVLDYYREVEHNSVFYGVVRRETAMQIQLHPLLAGDWLAVAAIAFSGKIRTLPNTCLYRRWRNDSISSSKDRLTKTLKLSRLHIPYFYTSASLNVFNDILFFAPQYRSLRFPRRVGLAFRAFTVICKKHDVKGEIKRSPVIRLPYRLLKKLFLKSLCVFKSGRRVTETR